MRPTLNPVLEPFRTRLGARLMLVFIGVALAPMLVGVLLSYQRARASLVNLALSKVEQEAALTAKDLGTSLEQFSSDLLMLSNAPPVQGLLLAQDHGGQDPATGRSYSVVGRRSSFSRSRIPAAGSRPPSSSASSSPSSKPAPQPSRPKAPGWVWQSAASWCT
jgi:hypothetical protein